MDRVTDRIECRDNVRIRIRDMPKKRDSYRKYIGMFGDILVPFFIYFSVYLLAIFGLTSLVITILQNEQNTWQGILLEQEVTVNAVIGGFAMLIGVTPLVPAFRREAYHQEQQNYYNNREDKGVHTKGDAKADTITGVIHVLVTIALAVTSSVAINIFFILFHLTENSETYAQTAEHQYSVLFPFGLFLYGIISPLAEEVIFRGIIYNRMKKYMPVIISMLLSSLLFGLYHGNLVQTLYGFCMGTLIAYTYERFGKFFYAFLFHAAANVTVYTVTGSPKLYELIIRVSVGIVFACIACGLLWGMKRDGIAEAEKKHVSQEND